jgi:hypothetical protein
MSFVMRSADARARRRPIGLSLPGWHVASVLAAWLPLTVTIVLVCGIVYLTAQQVLRQDANDPQVQLAEDTAAALLAGRLADLVLPPGKVDVAASLAPWVIVFDDAGRIVASSAEFGSLPLPPSGVLEAARRDGQTRVTWQPRPGVRAATVVQRYGGSRPGFVMAGRSLRESEARSEKLLVLIAAAGVAALVVSFVAVAAAITLGARWLRPV